MRVESGRPVRRGRLFGGAAMASALFATGSVWAQEAPAAQTGGDQVADIVVTAQKREQRLQDVPVAVTALSAETLQANRITNVSDLSGLAPNVTVRAASGSSSIPTFSARGIVSYGVVPGSDKQVSIYLDGVYIGAPRGSIFDIPDIARIEMLRGPQGTLFGRNATAGAISVVTRAPRGEFGGRIDATVGNYDQRRFGLSIDTPTWGPFSGYASFSHRERRGDIRNTGAGTVWDRTGPGTLVGVQTSPEYLGDKDVDSWFAAVRFEPSDTFTTTYKFDRSVDHFTPEGQGLIGINASSPLIGPLLNALMTSQAEPVRFNLSAKRPKEMNNAYAVPGIQRNSGHSLTSEWQPTSSISIKNIVAYRESYVNSTSQFDGHGGLTFTQQALVPYATFAAFSTNPALATATPEQQGAAIQQYATALAPLVGSRLLVVGLAAQDSTSQWSEELQVNFDSDAVSLTAGVMYFSQTSRSGGPRGIESVSSFKILPTNGRIPLVNDSTSYNEATSLAAYVQADFHVTPQLDLVAGYRTTRDEKSGTFVAGGAFVPSTPGSYTEGTYEGQTLYPFEYEDTQPSYTLGANYKPNDDLLIYGKYSRSFVSGGSTGGIGFAPEIAKSWEAGIKADFMNRSLRTNLAVFLVDYEALQSAQGGLSVGRPQLGTVIIEQGDAKAKGFELEVFAAPMQGLTLSGSLGFTDVEYGRMNPILPASVGGGEYLPTLIPDWTSNLSAQYETAPMTGGAYWVFRADATWRSEQRTYHPLQASTIPIFEAIEFSPAAWIVNARVSVRDIPVGGNLAEIAIWGRNLTDDKSTSFPLGFADFLTSSSFQQARTFGLDVSFKF